MTAIKIIKTFGNQVPSMASCTRCDYKFLTPNTLRTDRVAAESYLADKFGMHECGQGGSSFGRRGDMRPRMPFRR
jgi:hypothetical protein